LIKYVDIYLINIYAHPSTPSVKNFFIINHIDNNKYFFYRKLIRTSYMLAQKGVPPTVFPVTCEIQKKNGVQLISGGGTSWNKGKEYMITLATEIKEDIVRTVKASKYFSVLIDGSQPGKCGREKELVYVRALKDGKPQNFCLGLLEIDGDANAANIKQALENLFVEIGLEQEWKEKLVCATADGAAVNFGAYNGVLTQLAAIRPWMLRVHCVSHQTE
jgi:hypothetical protein